MNEEVAMNWEKKNVVIFNIPESTNDNFRERQEYDHEEVQYIFQNGVEVPHVNI